MPKIVVHRGQTLAQALAELRQYRYASVDVADARDPLNTTSGVRSMSGFIKVSAKETGVAGGFKPIVIRTQDIVEVKHTGVDRCTVTTERSNPPLGASYDCNQSVDTIADLLGAQAAPPAVTPYPQPTAPVAAPGAWGAPPNG